MDGTFPGLVLAALGAVLLVLALGLWNLQRGGNPGKSQKLMRWRIGLQFAAICIAMIAIYLSSR